MSKIQTNRRLNNWSCQCALPNPGKEILWKVYNTENGIIKAMINSFECDLKITWKILISKGMKISGNIQNLKWTSSKVWFKSRLVKKKV